MKHENSQTYISKDERRVEVKLSMHSSRGGKNYA